MSYVGQAKQIGRGFVIAEAVTALSLPTIPQKVKLWEQLSD